MGYDETIPQAGEGEPGTEEAEALAAALNHSAERVQTLWFSFLTFMVYLAIATGTTTHRMLFLESPLNLPVLNIALPLLGFYILTPIIFVVFHFYMLLNLVLLARTAKSFEDSLTRAFPEDSAARENFRMRIENTLFVQLLVGGRLEREGINAKLLSLMGLITLALAPVALLLFLEIKFLPYHSEWITWLHRGLLVLGLMLVWTLWPGYRSGWGVRLWPKRSWRLAVPGALSAMAVAFAALVATFPDERMYLATNWLHRPITWDPFSGNGYLPNWYLYPFYALANTLDLHGEELIDDAKLAHIIEKNESSIDLQRRVATLHLMKRDLTGANLERTDIRYIDFSGAILNRANLNFVRAKEARFDSASLQGANLYGAQLQAASLKDARLETASLDRANLQGASLDGAELQAASLVVAKLQGASLDHATLQGAWLDGAKLQGAWLYDAQLQGASLEGAQLQGASIISSFVWRADGRTAVWTSAYIVIPEPGAKYDCSSYISEKCDWTVDQFEKVKMLIAEQVREDKFRPDPTERVEQRLDPTKALEGEDAMAEVWAAQAASSEDQKVYEKSRAEQWRETGCAAEGAPYVLLGLLSQLDQDYFSPFAEDSPERPKLAVAFLGKDCAGAHGLSEAEITKLKAIRDSAPSPAPKQ